MRLFLILVLSFPSTVFPDERAETRELVGRIGSRSALLVLHATQRADAGWQLSGEYIVLPTLVRRFVQGERGPELGVTTLKEGTTSILYARDPVGELRGVWRDGVFKGTRYGPGGQKREEFEFSEDFPSMDDYSAKVRCEAKEGRYQSRLSLSIEQGKLKNFEWRSVEPGGQACTVRASAQEPLRGGLRFVSGSCRVTLRDVGDFVALSAENCAALCGAEAYLEPLLFDRRGNCELLRHGAR